MGESTSQRQDEKSCVHFYPPSRVRGTEEKIGKKGSRKRPGGQKKARGRPEGNQGVPQF